MTLFPKGSIENPSKSEDFPNITGSVSQMIQAAMKHFRNLFIREKFIKVPNQMETLRIFNYPYQAIEEAVVNAFYHRLWKAFHIDWSNAYTATPKFYGPLCFDSVFGMPPQRVEYETHSKWNPVYQ